MEEIIAWVKTEGRLPDDRSPDRGQRSLARWLSARRRESAEGTLDPAYGHELAQLPGWAENRRETADEARWREHLAELVDFRQKATIGLATTTLTPSVNTPSESGFTPSATSGTAATSPL